MDQCDVASDRCMDRAAGHRGLPLGPSATLPGSRSRCRLRLCRHPLLRAMGIRDKPISAGSPWQNGFAERLIGTLRRECVDHMVVLGQAHLRRTLIKFADYYNTVRLHRSLAKDAPFSRRSNDSASSPHDRSLAVSTTSIAGFRIQRTGSGSRYTQVKFTQGLEFAVCLLGQQVYMDRRRHRGSSVSPGAVPHDVAHQVAHVVLQISWGYRRCGARFVARSGVTRWSRCCNVERRRNAASRRPTSPGREHQPVAGRIGHGGAVLAAFDGVARTCQSVEHAVAGSVVGQHDGGVPQGGGAGRRR